jgi:uncharacterized membrane protein
MTLDEYFNELRVSLRGLPDADVAEIVAELRSHVIDSGVSEDLALQRLGSPRDLGRLYQTESLLARASRSRSPLLMLRSVVRWAGISVAGFWVLLGLLAGYAIALSFAIASIVKLFAPGRAGLWRLADGSWSLHLGFVGSPPVGHELLGWWIVPVGLLLGAACVRLTMAFGRWCIRRFRK